MRFEPDDKLETSTTGGIMLAIELDLQPADLELSDEQFYHLCQGNRDLRLERTATGKLIIMPPTRWGTGNRNLRLGQLGR